MEQTKSTRELYSSEGLSKHELRRLHRDGALIKVRRGAYAGQDASGAQAHLRLITATMPLIGEQSVLSHFSAAVLHGIPIPSDRLSKVWATRPAGGNGRRGSVLHLRRCRLDADEIVELQGLSVTSLARTAIDLARLLSLEWGVVACDAARRSGVEESDLLEAAARAKGWPGAHRAWTAASFADPRSESPLESISRLQLHRLGFPTPSLQYAVLRAGHVVATSDFGWEAEGLIGECDGKVKYGELLRPGESAADAVMREKRREERIRGAGFWIVRWGWDEAWNPPVLRSIVQQGFVNASRLAASASSSPVTALPREGRYV